MKLFIANTSKQHADLYLRIPEVSQLYQIHIPHGEQREIYPERGFTSAEDIETTLLPFTNLPKPHCISVSDAARAKGFAGLIFSVDKPVPQSVMSGRMEANDKALTEDSIAQQAIDAQFTRQAIVDATEGGEIGGVQVALSSQEEGKTPAEPERVFDVAPEGTKPIGKKRR
jgi:hypothetical protein